MPEQLQHNSEQDVSTPFTHHTLSSFSKAYKGQTNERNIRQTTSKQYYQAFHQKNQYILFYSKTLFGTYDLQSEIVEGMKSRFAS